MSPGSSQLFNVVFLHVYLAYIEKIEMSLGTIARLGIAYWDQCIRVQDYLSVCVGGDPNGPWSIDLAYNAIHFGPMDPNDPYNAHS